MPIGGGGECGSLLQRMKTRVDAGWVKSIAGQGCHYMRTLTEKSVFLFLHKVNWTKTLDGCCIAYQEEPRVLPSTPIPLVFNDSITT